LNIFISGISSGLGRALAKHYISNGHKVYGISRRPAGILGVEHHCCDLSDFSSIAPTLNSLLKGVDELNLVILNAGILGSIERMAQQNMDELKSIMDVNLWSNKVICDTLLGTYPQMQQLVAISSGAAVNGSMGWGGYSISKAALNMMIKLYASESTQTHFCSLAPGLIDTAMQDQLCDEVDPAKFPSVSRLKSARGTEAMPTPDQAAPMIAKAIDNVKSYDSGSFLDVRNF
jgi:NAD(P)-dependent dehydrogenase (short-subunit alcohol dehydrogenase family)